jgi:spermidine synthase
MNENWVTEVYKNIYRMSYKYSKKLFSGQSEFQKVEMYKTEHLGNVLLNDDFMMCSEKDEFVYHEMMAHVPLSVHPDPKKVLIIGGGDGGTAREVLKHPSVEKVVMVEIDEMVVNACKEFLPITACELGNPRLKLLIEDGVKYVQETTEKFDVVMIDSTDPIGPAAPLFGIEFYQNVFKCTTDNAIVVSQCESPFLFLETQQATLGVFSKVFSKVQIYNYSNITYPGGLWSFAFASKGLDPIMDFRQTVNEAMGLKYYNSQIHKASFCLPNFQKQSLSPYMK